MRLNNCRIMGRSKGTDAINACHRPCNGAERMKALTVRAFQALKLNVYSRADFILDADGNLYCLEMNTLPGMTSASLLPKEALADGIEYGDLCELIIQKSMEARYQ